MKIKITHDHGADVRLNAISTRHLPKGWAGDVADDVGAALVAEKKAEAVATAPADFTDAERDVLKRAAADVLGQQVNADAEADADDDSTEDGALPLDAPKTRRKKTATKSDA
jgi:hypothetical protein